MTRSVGTDYICQCNTAHAKHAFTSHRSRPQRPHQRERKLLHELCHPGDSKAETGNKCTVCEEKRPKWENIRYHSEINGTWSRDAREL